MLAKIQLQGARIVINSLLVAALVLSITVVGRASQPDEETVGSTVFLPFVMRTPGYQESIGELDPSFNGDGWLLTNFSGSMDDGYAVAVQPGDGKLVMAGSFDGTSRNFGLARFNTDGSLDTSFDEDGLVSTDFFGSYDDAYAIALQGDGKIVVAGSANNTTTRNDFALARYNSNGSLDTSFSSDGLVTTDFTGNVDYARAVAIQADNKIVAVGYTWNGSNYDFALVRYNQDGSLDTSFDTDGRVTTDFFAKSDYAYALVLAGDALVVAGYAKNGSYDDFALARYNANGSLDTSFDSDGKLYTNFFDKDDRGQSLVRQPDGKLIVAGWTDQGGNKNFALARYDTDGTPDLTFDVDGKVVTDFAGGQDYGYSIVLEPISCNVVVAGYTYDGMDNNFAMARYGANGALDPTFDGDGMVISDFNSRPDYGHALVRQTGDGKLVVAGTAFTVAGSDFALARYNTDGSLDAGFDSDGRVVANLFGSSDLGQAVALHTDGRLVLAGHVTGSTGSDFGVARYYPEGNPDLSFDGDGRVFTDFNGGDDYAYAVASQADGKLVVAGSANTGGFDDFALVRYHPDGNLDVSFDGDGRVITDFEADFDVAYALLIEPDGKLVVAGGAWTATSQDFALARYNPDGSLDASFDGDGRVVTDFFGGDDCGRALIRQADGKLLVAGFAENGAYYDFALARYNSNGSLDTTFDGDGRVVTDVNGADDFGYALVLQADNKIVVAGSASSGAYANFALVRYNANGSLDTSFDSDGRVITSFSSSNDYATGIVLQPNGKLVAAGLAYTGNGYDFTLARFLSNGSLDTSFSDNGWLVTDFYGGDDHGMALLMLPGGQFVVAGYADNGTDYDFALARYR
jgi:uncharacterized delta-60 repeat protein